MKGCNFNESDSKKLGTYESGRLIRMTAYELDVQGLIPCKDRYFALLSHEQTIPVSFPLHWR
jgi:hypothetical protein